MTTGTSRKRLDLQGLRAVAVLLVALNHAQVPFFRGGYVGVDVFFVMSGYFITGILLRQGFGTDDREIGHVSIRDFYARRARRILPAACLTLLTTSLAVYVLYDLMGRDFLETKPVLEDAFAASLFFVNIHFIQTANNYFAQAATTFPSPVTHFWSLSVEEQFYIVWPSLLAAVFFVCRRRGRRRGEPAERQRRRATRLIGVLIAVGCAGSLAWSIRQTATDPQVAYYSTLVRAWEFGCGAALALLSARPRDISRLPRALLGWLGLAMIAAATVEFSGRTAFPGDAALLPVAGTALIILAGMLRARGDVAGPLAWRPLTYIGDRSYTFYLWHYPALILVWQAAGHVLPFTLNLGLLAGAMALSSLTFAVYENPLRFARWMRGWRTAAMVPLSITPTVLAIAIPLALFNNTLAAEAAMSHRAKIVKLTPARGQPHPSKLWDVTAIPAVGAAAKAARQERALPKSIIPAMSVLERENTHISYDIPPGCQAGFGNHAQGRICRLGDPSSKRVVAVIGDSHGGMWFPGLEGAARARHFAVVALDKPGCLLGDAHKNLPGWPCADWYRWAVRQDHKLRPVATIVAYQFSAPLQNHPSTTIAELQGVLSDVTRGVLLEDPPGQTQQPAECIAQPGATMGTCSSRIPSSYVPFVHDVATMVRRTHHPVIPTLQWFCGRGVCPMVVDHTLTERDKSHLTTEYSAELAPLLALELRPILARSEQRAARSGATGSSPPDGSGMARSAGLGAVRLGECQCTASARRSAFSRRAMCP